MFHPLAWSMNSPEWPRRVSCWRLGRWSLSSCALRKEFGGNVPVSGAQVLAMRAERIRNGAECS